MREYVSEIAQALGYAWNQTKDQPATGVTIDSRAVKPGDLFVAIVGEKTDGHRYLRQALDKGAAAVVVSRPEVLEQEAISDYILVSDGTEFLQQLAHWLRRKMTAPVVAVTGSTGKTSTKDFLAALLAPLGNLVVTKGNHNNELGLPLTICELEADTKVLVVEMGMRGLGQIDFLCRIAEPDYGIITNIGKTHCELLGSQENIAQAKCELLPYIRKGGMVALNCRDKDFLQPWLQSCGGDVKWYSMDGAPADFWADEIVQDEDGISYCLHAGDYTQTIHLTVQGVHNVSNSLAAIAIAHELGVTWEQIGECLHQAKLTGMRLDVTVNAAGVTVINDAYNANPDSMKSAISVLMQKNGKRKVAVLGDMYELGKYEEESHREVGRAAAEQGVDLVVAVGKLGRLIGEEAQAQGANVQLAGNNEDAYAYVQQYVQNGDVVLVKGSRGMQMEQIVQKLMG